jgi:YARHG domain
MRFRRITAAVLVLAGAILAARSRSYAQDCQSLWLERNLFYKNAGFCFKQARAIKYFGNGGCSFNDPAALPLSPSVRKRIAQITQVEQKLGCSE